MPEGDTIRRAARSLAAALVGKEVRALRSYFPEVSRARLVGRKIVAVEAVGKHLLIRFDDGRALHSHMRMTGSWRVLRPGAPYAEHLARCVIEVEGALAVCMRAPTIRVLGAKEVDTDRRLVELGPDVLGRTFDFAEARARLRRTPDREIGDGLLDQTCVAGIGNIYKSESLFRACVDPWTKTGVLDDATLERILREARRLMHASLNDGRARRWVYDRARLPCRRCGELVQVRRQGVLQRATYWCPRCQKTAGNPVTPS
jgi:endonuclease-8